MEKATLAGGCFWCMEAVFKRLKGVSKVTSGYAGGKMENPSYEDVSMGKAGHAEAIQIEFDPKVISFTKLLDIFWALHDPTTLNRQGSDIGTQYRSAIFYHSQSQKRIAELSKKRADKSGVVNGKIVTEIKSFTNFYPAEDYHQNYYERNKNFNRYCLLVIDPKIDKLIEKFNKFVKKEFL